MDLEKKKIVLAEIEDMSPNDLIDLLHELGLTCNKYKDTADDNSEIIRAMTPNHFELLYIHIRNNRIDELLS